MSAEVHKHINKLLARVGKQKLHTVFTGVHVPKQDQKVRPHNHYIYIYIYTAWITHPLHECCTYRYANVHASVLSKTPLSLSTQGLVSGHTFAPSLSCGDRPAGCADMFVCICVYMCAYVLCM